MMKNKKAMLPFIWTIIAVLILIIVASLLGLLFINKFIASVGMRNILIVLGVLLAIVFHKPLIQMFMGIINILKALLK